MRVHHLADEEIIEIVRESEKSAAKRTNFDAQSINYATKENIPTYRIDAMWM